MTQDKVTVAKQKANAAWAKWKRAHDECRKAYFSFFYKDNGTPAGVNNFLTWSEYEELFEKRDDLYQEAVLADEDVWNEQD
jgi:hypothetical protein